MGMMHLTQAQAERNETLPPFVVSLSNHCLRLGRALCPVPNVIPILRRKERNLGMGGPPPNFPRRPSAEGLLEMTSWYD